MDKSRRVRINILIIVVCLVLLAQGAVPAADVIDIPGLGGVAADYPGWIKQGESFLDFAGGNITWGLVYYYRAFGHWPNRWQDVVAAGIHQVPIIALSGDVINPDDGKFDCLGDVYYFPPNANSPDAFIAKLSPNEGYRVKYTRVPVPDTFEKQFGDFFMNDEASARFDRQSYVYWTATAERRRFLAILGVVDKCMPNYYYVHGDYPQTWQQFATSGLSPIDQSSVNPLTGGPFHGDGRALDFQYTYYPADKATQQSSFTILPVDENGKTPSSWCTF